jgi:hypothetical protein
MSFLTFTAPGAEVFGATHQRHEEGKSKRIARCRCGVIHNEDDELIGTPINPRTYRYDLAADFNANAGRLLAISMQKLGRIVGRKLKYVRVAEFQRRGLIHFHVLVEGIITDRSMRLVVSGGKSLRSNRTITAAKHGRWSWGSQCDVKRILPGGRVGIGAYLVKIVGYAVKSTKDSAAGSRAHERGMRRAAARTCTCKKGMDCRYGSRRMENSPHFYQGKQSDRSCRRHILAQQGWGFRGHVLSISRRWGTLNFKMCRERRQGYVAGGSQRGNLDQIVTWKVLNPLALNQRP